jgi:hypothetical protein
MIPQGATVYSLGAAPVAGIGLLFTQPERDASIKGPVASVAYDDIGNEALSELLRALPETGFASDNVKATLNQTTTLEGWRIGEAFAECYLVEHRSCTFPWPDGRDARKRTASLPGADLVGFTVDSTGACRFAFGEVKTSSERKYPPGVCHGSTGLKQQLEDLRDKEDHRDDLVLYLGHRAAMGATWSDQFKAAASRYFQDKCDLRVYGVLVRDVPPNSDDLRVRVKSLGTGCPATMSIELMALYLPDPSIADLGALAAESRKEKES